MQSLSKIKSLIILGLGTKLHIQYHKMAMHKIKFTQFIILVAIKATTGQMAGMIFEGKNHLSVFVTKSKNIFSFQFYLLEGVICDCDLIIYATVYNNSNCQWDLKPRSSLPPL